MDASGQIMYYNPVLSFIGQIMAIPLFLIASILAYPSMLFIALWNDQGPTDCLGYAGAFFISFFFGIILGGMMAPVATAYSLIKYLYLMIIRYLRCCCNKPINLTTEVTPI